MTPEEYGVAYSRGYSKTIGFMLSRGISREMSEELAQAAWTKGWQYRGQIRDHQKLDAWVNSIAFNLFRGSLRQVKTVELLALDSRESASTVPQALVCQRLLAQCSLSERRLIKGHYVAGYTSAELGRVLGISPVAVRVRLSRLHRRLRATMGSEQTCTPSPASASHERELRP